MKRTILLVLCLMALLISQAAAAKRVLTLLEVKRGNGVNTEEVDFIKDKLDSLLKAQAVFDLRPRGAVSALVEKLGGCTKEDCYNTAAKELKINLLLTVGLAKG